MTLPLTKLVLSTWLAMLPLQKDGYHRGIPRPQGFTDVIAVAVLEGSDDPVQERILAATLDVLAAHESGYRQKAVGDSGRSCGAWQTPCGETPLEGDHVGLKQARIAVKWVKRSFDLCPDYPLAKYATGVTCGSVRIADYYWRQVRLELESPLPQVATQIIVGTNP